MDGQWHRRFFCFLILFALWAPAPSSSRHPNQQNSKSVAPQKESAQQIAERNRCTAEEKVKKEVEDAACRHNLQCWGDRHNLGASMTCDDAVERLANYATEWTDGYFEAKFGRFRWKDETRGVITYVGDKIRFQNGFGAWQNYIYECDFDTLNMTALAVRAHPGRLSPD